MGLRERYGPWAVVAGASEGIGEAFARRLAAELRAQHGQPIETLALDLAAPDWETHARDIAATRDVGLVVYNAALSIAAPFLATPLADHQRMLDVNTRGPLLACHVFGGA